MKKTVFYLFFIALIGLSNMVARAQRTLPSIISDGMVLQRNSSDPIWGWASPHQPITVEGSWNNKPFTTHADKYGQWMMNIQAPPAGGPFTLRISADTTITLHNVMSGEVWIASGQSNMEMPLSGWPNYPLLHSKKVISEAHYSDIHLFNVQHSIAISPRKDVQGSWAATTPESVSNFSAAAYFFGLQLHQKLHVPIGLIASDWGGTVAEAWTSDGGLRKVGDFDSTLNRLQTMRPRVKELKKKAHQYEQQWNKRLKKTNRPYASEQFNDEDWKTMDLPTVWEKAGYPNLDGIVWFRKKVRLPGSLKGQSLKLSLGTIDDNDITWFNGKKIGATDGYYHIRSYNIPAKLVHAGTNIIAIRVLDKGGNGGIHGKKKFLNLHPSKKSPGDTVSLAGPWKYKIAAKKPSVHLIDNPNTASVLFNGMIAPLIPYRMRGVIWYQGESNVGRAQQYANLFPAMIKDWRNHWNEGNFPFYFVQIAPFSYGGNGTAGAALRDAQRRSLRVSHTGMVVTMDIGDTTLIHPANKQAVGKRLALWALSHEYGYKNRVYSGPLYESMKVKGNQAIISFRYVEGGLTTHGKRLKGFEVAGADSNFVPAQAHIKGNKVILQAHGVSHPTAVRYAWRDTAQAYLFNKAGLPASTFSTLKQ